MGFTTSYWQKERWSRRAADTLTSYGRCWKPNPGMPAAKMIRFQMIRFHKSAQDGWLQKQLFLQCSSAAAPRRPNLSVRQGSVASHSQPLYRVRARLKPSLRSTLGNFGTRLTQTAPLEGISPDKSASQIFLSTSSSDRTLFNADPDAKHICNRVNL